MSKLSVPDDYAQWLSSLKSRIQGARARAVLAANQELVHLYHQIGTEILERQKRQGWGARVIDRLAGDLRGAFPDMKGLSSRNLNYMKVFAEMCPGVRFVQQPAAQLPWFHIVTLLTKVPDASEREWYAARAVEHAWSRATLEVNIRDKLHLRQGAALTNFERHLPEPHAQLAAQVLKDPYHFDFLGLGDEAHERDIEGAALRHITRFLLELGSGFAFVGRQHRLEVDGREFFIDLLFYHTRLKCYVVVELKTGEFDPAHTGQLGFYLVAVDKQIKASDDKPTIGMLLCKTKNRLVAEYALAATNRPMGIAEYHLVRALPEPLDTALPRIEQIEEDLSTALAQAEVTSDETPAPPPGSMDGLQESDEADRQATLPPSRATAATNVGAIAGALADLDALVGSLDRLIAKKRNLKQAAMQQLLTAQTRLPGFSEGWKTTQLGEVARFRTGPFGSALHKSDYTTNGVPLVNPMHIVGGNQHILARLVLHRPNVDEQTAIAAVLSDMDAEIVALEQRRDKTRLLKQGMMQELLTGRTSLARSSASPARRS